LRTEHALTSLWSNWVTLLGSIITTVSGIALVYLLVVAVTSTTENPYASLMVVVVLPAAFAVGLLLIPIGLRVEHRRRAMPSREAVRNAFEGALADPSARARVLFVTLATLANIGLFAWAGTNIAAHMNSPEFCGTTCHTPMQPEWETWRRSPHSSVACVECHIGPGDPAEVKAKVNGVRQMIHFVTASFPRPVPAPVESLRSARETCGRCHAPERFEPRRIKLFPHYAPDKDNTPKFNAMVLRVGGLDPRTQRYQGIHWHLAPGNVVRYEYYDEERNEVGKITVLTDGKVTAEYLPPGPPKQVLGVRTVDCTDCHNRVAHPFAASPKEAVDHAIFEGGLDPKLPFIAQVSAALLGQAAVPRRQAGAHFRQELPAAYEKEHPEVKPDPQALAKAAATLATLYEDNIFPDMRVGWSVYRSNVGHKAEGVKNPGCFRCHDGKRQATLADGRTKKLSQDCDTCHVQVAFEEDPEKFGDVLSAMMPGN
jgi:nitrate/TMAO reductase-like tetraheme cytochrome c subunit